jgi:hypothetical protein
MKKLAVLIVLVCELALAGCGGNTTTTAATTSSGLWQAVLAGGSGEGSVLSFNMNFTVNGDGSLSVSQFGFLTTGTCFVSGETESGTSTLVTDASGVVTGPISFVVQSGSPAGNTLTLTGNETTSSDITGTWTLTAATGCTDTGGTFTMTKTAT